MMKTIIILEVSFSIVILKVAGQEKEILIQIQCLWIQTLAIDVDALFDNLDIDEPIFAKLIVTGKDDVREEFLIAGVNSYSAETGMAYVEAYILFSEGVGAYNTTYFGG